MARIREVMPAGFDEFNSDRTVKEVVILNLFVALQHCLTLATHWLADEGKRVPPSYREVFRALASDSIMEPELAERLGGAVGLRNLIAHRYGVLDWKRIHEIASSDLDDLLYFCKSLAESSDDS